MTLFRKLCAMALFTLSIGLSGGPADAKVEICYEDHPWDHYYLGSGSEVPDRDPGILIELINMAGAEAGITLDYFRMPWKRCLLQMKHNDMDAVIGAAYLPERADYLVFPTLADGRLDDSRALFNLEYFLYSRTDSRISWNGDTLTGFSGEVAAVHSYAVRKIILRELGLATNHSSNVLTGLRLVNAGRLDLYAGAASYTDPIIAEHALPVRKLKPAFNRAKAHLVFSHDFERQNPETVNLLWHSIAELPQAVRNKLWQKYQREWRQ